MLKYSMPDYTFTFTKQFNLSFDASTEHEAWMQAMTFMADTYPSDWTVKLNESFNPQLDREQKVAPAPEEFPEADDPDWTMSPR